MDEELYKDLLKLCVERDIAAAVAIMTLATLMVNIIDKISNGPNDALEGTRAIVRDMVTVMEDRANAN